MLHVVVARQVDALIEALCADVARDCAGLSAAGFLFRGIPVLVPSREAETVVLRALARAHGGVMNVECQSLERYLERAGQALPRPAVLWDQPTLEREILRYLLATPWHQLPEPIARYLGAAGATEAATARRMVMLARRLSESFELFLSDAPPGPDGDAQYWLPCPDSGPDWLRALYMQILGAQVQATAPHEAVPGQRLTLDALARVVAQSRARAPGSTAPVPLYVYSLPPLSRAQSAALLALAHARTLRLYTQIPDVPDHALSNLGRLVLDEWAAPARASVRALAPAQTRSASLGQPRAAEPPSSPRSAVPLRARVTVLACPTPRREIESVAARIWEHVRLSHDAVSGARVGAAGEYGAPVLRFSDIGVIIPPVWAEVAHTLIASVFSEAGLPYRIVGAPLARSSPIVDTIARLIRLPGGDYTREEVLRVLTSEPVLAGAADAGAAASWIALCERLGIVRGACAHDLRDTYLADDRVSWEHGLTRLALGFFLAAEPGAPVPIFDAGVRRYLPAELGVDAQPPALEFAQAAHTLLKAGRALRAARLPISVWIARFSALITRLVVPRDGSDERALYACLAQLRALDDPSWTEPLSYAVASEILANAIEHLTATVAADGEHEGVLVAPLAAARGRTFRVLFLCGMGLGQFPAPEIHPELDLRAASWASTGRARARDRTFFAEALFNTEDAIYLSYQAREPTTGEPLEPSVLVRECELVLGAACTHETIPLERDLDALARRNLDVAASEAHARALAEFLGPTGASTRTAAELRAKLLEYPSVASVLGPVFTMPTGADRSNRAPNPGRPRARVRLDAIRRFLECPMQAAARMQLRIGAGESEEDGDIARLLVSDEPTELAGGRGTRLLQLAFEMALATAVAEGKQHLSKEMLASAHDALYERLVLSGGAAVGVPGHKVCARHREILASWADALNACWPELSDSPRIVCWGGTASLRPINTFFPPILLPPARRAETAPGAAPKTTRPELVGPVELVHESGITLEFRDGRRGIFVLGPTKRTEHGPQREQALKKGLAGFMDHLAWSAATDDMRPATVVFAAMSRDRDWPLMPLSRALALDYLRAMLDALIFDRHAYLLPCEAVFRCYGTTAGSRQSIRLAVRQLLDSGRPFSSRWGPVLDIEKLPIPDDQTAARLVAERLALYLHPARQITSAPAR